MKNKIFRKVDSHGRVTIPRELMEIGEINCLDPIAFVSVNEDMISFVLWSAAKDLHVIYKAKIDDKGRITIPLELREGVSQVEIFLYEGNVTIR